MKKQTQNHRNKLKENQAVFINRHGELSFHYVTNWNVPDDLKKLAYKYKKSIIGLGRWNASKEKNKTLFYCIASYDRTYFEEYMGEMDVVNLIYIEGDLLKQLQQ